MADDFKPKQASADRRLLSAALPLGKVCGTATAVRRLSQKQIQRVVLLTGLLAWMGSQMMVLVHQIVVHHTRCAEHGELIEVGGEAEDATDQATLSADDTDDDHDHDCVIDGITVELVAKKHKPAAIKRTLILHEPLRLSGGGARAPPLSYAPKTSPPPTC